MFKLFKSMHILCIGLRLLCLTFGLYLFHVKHLYLVGINVCITFIQK